MNATSKSLKLALVALLAMAGSAAASACSSDDNAAPTGPTVLDSGSPDGTTEDSGNSESDSGGSSSGGDSGSGTDAKSDAAPCTPDGGASATCNSCATVGGNDSLNTCSAFGCAGYYNNAMHGVPSTLPSP
jgi:hypothetical protein